MTRIALVVAVARNGVIGAGGRLPWRLADDLQFFRRVTMGKPIVMGRKTFDSIGRPLPGRLNIVVTRDVDWRREGALSAPDLDAAIALARRHAPDAEEICVIGGAEIYRQAAPLADRIYLTRVDATPQGDATFAAGAPGLWRETPLGSSQAGPRNDHDCAFFRLDRIAEN